MSVENPILPEGWNDHDLQQASMDMTAFLDTKGYAWLANWVGVNHRWAEKDLLAKNPMTTPHDVYVQNHARREFCSQFIGAVSFIVGQKENGT